MHTYTAATFNVASPTRKQVPYVLMRMLNGETLLTVIAGVGRGPGAAAARCGAVMMNQR